MRSNCDGIEMKMEKTKEKYHLWRPKKKERNLCDMLPTSNAKNKKKPKAWNIGVLSWCAHISATSPTRDQTMLSIPVSIVIQAKETYLLIYASWSNHWKLF